jgi:hypothetical protein
MGRSRLTDLVAHSPRLLKLMLMGGSRMTYSYLARDKREDADGRVDFAG